ncbi:hypothetical protein DES42_106219 [Zavarzinia compransoris]|uniref:HTH iclR-type domain-containing protein n=2 Tax=Zavarzinia compransoris TaxID=1264899 RepID=A0A317DYW5_9PROT|nr:hypothetical protein DKG75_15660 [Zavarzinia compransoris]TDP44998.1 hypothetical protein DES42_106219 [Zavarzinia compransoris]
MMRAFVEFHRDFYRFLTPLFDGDIETVCLAEALTLRAGPLAFLGAGPAEDAQAAAAAAGAGTLAHDLGLPWETARRKLCRLVERGIALKEAGGRFRLRPGTLAGPRFLDAGAGIGALAAGFLNRCLREGYIGLERAGPGGTRDKLPLDPERPRQIAEGGRPDGRELLRLSFSWLFIEIYLVRSRVYERDIEQALISDAVGLFAVEQLYHSPEYRDRLGSMAVILGENQKGVSARWVAEQTGLPRETVRRKLKRMVETGFLSETEDSRYIFKPGLFLRPDIVAAVQAIERLIVEFLERTLRLGIFVVMRDEADSTEV